jgi:anthranilate phosphoribosyltransferase
VLEGERGPRRDLVILNAAAALWVAEQCRSLGEGARLAADAMDCGAAARTLDRYIEISRESREEEEA